MEGVFFRTVLDVTPELDRAVLKDLRQKADELGIYLEPGSRRSTPTRTPRRRRCASSAAATTAAA